MKISVFEGNQPHQMATVDHVMDLNMKDLISVICSKAWSPFIFKKDPTSNKIQRNQLAFEATELLVFDIDEGMSLKQAIETCKDDSVVIATTKSHQQEKISGKTIKPACDRFRVIKVLERPILCPDEYRATWKSEAKKLGCVDQQCKDMARFYFPCRELMFQQQANKTQIVTQPPTKNPKLELQKTNLTSSEIRGRLFPSTLSFIENGVFQNWHSEFFKAAVDLKEQNYPYLESYTLLERGAKLHYGYLDEHDIAVLKDVYSNNRGGKYSLRLGYSAQNCPEKRITPIEQFRPPTESELAAVYATECAIRQRTNKNALTFLDPAFDPHFKLTYGVTVIGAGTGAGKTTVAANISYQVLLSEKCSKRILLLSNEETVAETYSKLACLMLGLDWKRDYRDGLDIDKQELIDATAKGLVSRITVVTSSDEYDTSDLDDVKRILEHAKAEKETYSLVIIDYLQTISSCRTRPGLKSWEISKELGNFLKKYAQTSEIPVIVFAQLWPEGDQGRSDFFSRIQNDRNFANHCHCVLEIIPDHNTFTTKIKCHKQRWGSLQNWEVELRYNRGKLSAF